MFAGGELNKKQLQELRGALASLALPLKSASVCCGAWRNTG
jgi:hypothetical protein